MRGPLPISIERCSSGEQMTEMPEPNCQCGRTEYRSRYVGIEFDGVVRLRYECDCGLETVFELRRGTDDYWVSTPRDSDESQRRRDYVRSNGEC